MVVGMVANVSLRCRAAYVPEGDGASSIRLAATLWLARPQRSSTVSTCCCEVIPSLAMLRAHGWIMGGQICGGVQAVMRDFPRIHPRSYESSCVTASWHRLMGKGALEELLA